jgi:hypothetical protein
VSGAQPRSLREGLKRLLFADGKKFERKTRPGRSGGRGTPNKLQTCVLLHFNKNDRFMHLPENILRVFNFPMRLPLQKAQRNLQKLFSNCGWLTWLITKCLYICDPKKKKGIPKNSKKHRKKQDAYHSAIS